MIEALEDVDIVSEASQEIAVRIHNEEGHENYLTKATGSDNLFQNSEPKSSYATLIGISF